MSSVYEIVTNKIIEQLEAGVIPWQKPWRTEMPVNLKSGKQYRGINVFLLATQGYGSKYWVSGKQVADMGGTILPGQRSTLVTFWNVGTAKKLNKDTQQLETKRTFLLRYYNVYNVEQTTLAATLGLGGSERTPDIEACEKIVASMPNRPGIIRYHRAWYRPSTDQVGIPSKTAFDSPEGYFSTLFHELTHSTGHKSRVGREGIETLNTFGSESYSKEELVAELGAAMLGAVAGIAPRITDNSVAYLQSWIKALKGDSRLIVSAASQAQKAADYILGIKFAEKPSEQTEPAGDELKQAELVAEVA